MLQLVPQAIPLIDYLDHDDRIRDEELLDQAGCLDLGMRHEQNNHDFDFVNEGEKVQKFGYVVQHRVKNPVGRPMRELCMINFLTP